MIYCKFFIQIRFLLFSLGILYSVSATSQSDCARFKNGFFKYEIKKYGTGYVRRLGDIQYEVLEGKTDTSSYHVKWIGDCTYTLRPTEKTFKKFNFLPHDAVLTVEIVETSKNSYTQTSSSNFAEGFITSEMFFFEK